jgi:hypothetical protein
LSVGSFAAGSTVGLSSADGQRPARPGRFQPSSDPFRLFDVRPGSSTFAAVGVPRTFAVLARYERLRTTSAGGKRSQCPRGASDVFRPAQPERSAPLVPVANVRSASGEPRTFSARPDPNDSAPLVPVANVRSAQGARATLRGQCLWPPFAVPRGASDVFRHAFSGQEAGGADPPETSNVARARSVDPRRSSAAGSNPTRTPV